MVFRHFPWFRSWILLASSLTGSLMSSLLALFANSSAMHRSRAVVKVSSLTANGWRCVLDTSLSRRASSKKGTKTACGGQFLQSYKRHFRFLPTKQSRIYVFPQWLLEPVRRVLAAFAFNPGTIYCSGSLGHIDSLSTCKLVVQPLLETHVPVCPQQPRLLPWRSRSVRHNRHISRYLHQMCPHGHR